MKRPVTSPSESRSQTASQIPLAIVLEGVSEKWQMNVLQILGFFTSVKVKLDGYGTVAAPAILLSPDQARHLATQITELLGHEDKNQGTWENEPHFWKEGNP